jgi:hypothetical protein
LWVCSVLVVSRKREGRGGTVETIEPVDPALVNEAECGECFVCGRDFMFFEAALAHVTARPCREGS